MIATPQMDLFAPVADQERKVREELDHRIQSYQVQLEAVKALATLEMNMGFRQFLKAVDDASQRCEQQLRTLDGTDSQLRVIQGRAQAFREVLALCRDGQRLQERLAVLLSEAQDQRQRRILPNDKVIPPRSV